MCRLCPSARDAAGKHEEERNAPPALKLAEIVDAIRCDTALDDR
jgi:hypothetical protein